MRLYLLVALVGLLAFSGCKKQDEGPRSYTLFKKSHAMPQQPMPTHLHAMAQHTHPHMHPAHSLEHTQTMTVPMHHYQPAPATSTPQAEKEPSKIKMKKKVVSTEAELDFDVENKTGKPIYLACFSYIKKQDFTRWRWDKSKIYEVPNDTTVTIDVDAIPDKTDRESVYGYLAVFNNRKDAEESIYELLDDRYKIDLDLLHKLKGKKVSLGVEQYGMKGETLDYELVKKKRPDGTIPELDFVVENQTGKPVYLTAFVYQHKGSTTIWRFDKTPVVRLEPGQQTLIDIDTIAQRYERIYLRGYLGVFQEHEKQMALDSTYELLAPENKVKLGALFALQGKKVVLQVERYGVIGDMIDYTIKPIRHIQFGVKKVEPLSEGARLRAWR